MAPDLAGRLAEYAWGLGFGDLPPNVVHEAKRRVIDSLGCALGAYAAEPVKVARAVVHELGGVPAATILGSRDRSSPPLAAFVNGIMVRYLEEDPGLTERYPEAVPTVLEVGLRSGETVVERVDYPRGHARNPMSDAEVEQKFLSLTGGLLSPGQQDAALARLWRLEEEGDLRALLATVVV